MSVCVQGDKRKAQKAKTAEEIKNILEECSDYGEVVFTGGEVTLRNDLPELVEYARNLGYQDIQIQTNGRRFAYKNYCKKLINIKGLANLL